jgi:hypothetical protein
MPFYYFVYFTLLLVHQYLGPRDVIKVSNDIGELFVTSQAASENE